jgi:glutathione S-transferase
MHEMKLSYEIHCLPFPPRQFEKAFLGLNVLGTVPYFVDGTVNMTESSAICHYLVERYQFEQFAIAPTHAEYGDYLNWLYHSDATLTFPQTLVLRYRDLEPEERRQPQVVADYSKWFIARLRRLDAHIATRQYLCDERFTIADIAVGYALFLGELQGMSAHYSPQVRSYLTRLTTRPAFIAAAAIGAPEIAPR